ncbi:hypothetical protein SARC_05182 [Sphaeroforma arctica JP610]|uniref:Thymidine phosphorylase n=1 Tax=Sphaeroforma arctica JP610 TaxID=667725 RepID=A0A0L0G127_9EUKA|nr:hypothetical protein SARC_05182 [Sphaeroforma arctica JP610]KNC82534.1 hypothetical protein SARC_05182 [Sphaeroforma arctica JP610]|eukprot:XP_014156436.1 hypothetical protein SARC_05182 [Sphaeroforma arctica JP610]
MPAMNVASIIIDKRDGKELSKEQIEYLISHYADESVPDYQMAAWAMAVYLKGMTTVETATLTKCMIASGDTLKWPGCDKPIVDKHSTGGIGDKVSIPLAPMLASCGVCVPMISGRGLGITGGTLDKLESIPGFQVELSNEELQKIVTEVGCAIAGASSGLAPADKRLYSLRDVTGTVSSIPLITASILGKKLAEGIGALVMDVKWGSGAFMQTSEDARALATSLVTVGNELGVKTSAVITDMNQHLGYMIGNAVEINESVDILKGTGPPDVLELVLEFGANLLISCGKYDSKEKAIDVLMDTITSGTALKKFEEMVKAQGGDLNAPRKVAKAHVVTAQSSGYVVHINEESLGQAIIEMDGGRHQLGDALNHSTGICMQKKIGSRVEKGEEIATIFCDEPDKLKLASSLLAGAIGIGSENIDPLTLIVERL